MMRLSVSAALLTSVAFVVAWTAAIYVITDKDSLKPLHAIAMIWMAAAAYYFLRAKVVSAMERCTICGVMGSMFITMGLLTPDTGWVIWVMSIGAGVLLILSPHLFKERWERVQARDS